MLACLPGVPMPLRRRFQFFQQRDDVAPRQRCNGALHHFPVGPGGRKSPHVLQIAGGKAFHVWKGIPEIHGEPIDDPGTPTLLILLCEDALPKIPIEQYHGRVAGEGDPQPFSLDAALQVSKPLGIAVRQGVQGLGHREHRRAIRSTALEPFRG